ncbi:MAG: hypothetical protein APR63_02890 [Desulfuromonas sp. SDB]|nr:MAG: hypothetical protein APR63_02890 [Desulfuromonas sp. SDB]
MIPVNLSKFDCKRILIVGTSCSGKTKLAEELSSILNIPHIELDHLFWKPNWKMTPREEFYKTVKQKVSASTWIIDGNYSIVSDLTWQRATMIIWLNYCFPRIFLQGFIRTLKRIFFQEKLFGGNRETFQQSFFSKNSILWWIVYSYSRMKRKYTDTFSSEQRIAQEKIQLNSPRQKKILLDEMKRYIINKN